MDERSLDRFKVRQSTLDDVDGKGDGTRLVYRDGVWRAWRLRGGKPVGCSSGGFRRMEDAVRRLPSGNRKKTNETE